MAAWWLPPFLPLGSSVPFSRPPVMKSFNLTNITSTLFSLLPVLSTELSPWLEGRKAVQFPQDIRQRPLLPQAALKCGLVHPSKGTVAVARTCLPFYAPKMWLLSCCLCLYKWKISVLSFPQEANQNSRFIFRYLFTAQGGPG